MKKIIVFLFSSFLLIESGFCAVQPSTDEDRRENGSGASAVAADSGMKVAEQDEEGAQANGRVVRASTCEEIALTLLYAAECGGAALLAAWMLHPVAGYAINASGLLAYLLQHGRKEVTPSEDTKDPQYDLYLIFNNITKSICKSWEDVVIACGPQQLADQFEEDHFDHCKCVHQNNPKAICLCFVWRNNKKTYTGFWNLCKHYASKLKCWGQRPTADKKERFTVKDS